MTMKEIKVNFGCLASGLPGWINVDHARRHIIISRVPGLAKLLYNLGLLEKYMYDYHKMGKFKSVVHGDARKRLKFKDDSVDYIYSSHMLEHLYPKEAISFLLECRRVLKEGGTLRLLLPDLEFEAKKYLKHLGNKDAAKEFSLTIYAANSKKGSINGHKWMYDKYGVKSLLKKMGFRKVNDGKFSQGKFPEVKELDKAKNSLIIEATK